MFDVSDVLSSVPKRVWTKERIHLAFRELLARWERDAAAGAPAGARWDRKYVTLAGGHNLLRAIGYARLTPEIFLRQIGGEALDRWTRGRRVWDQDDERDTLSAAHARWKSDLIHGQAARRRFNAHWLERFGYRSRVALVYQHYPGGLQAFVRTVPRVYADWSFRKRVSTTEIRRQVRQLYRAWYCDPQGRLKGRAFGWNYLRRIGKRGLPKVMQRRGFSTIFRGRIMAPARRAWCRRIPKLRGGS